MFVQDVRYGFRQLYKSPGFTATVVLTLALSIGLATAVFCVIDAVILRPLPYAHPERIVSIETRSQSGYGQPASWPSFQDERAQVHAFAALAGYNDFSKATMETPANASVLLPTVNSTDNLFQVLGVQPILGRTYVAGEEADGKNQVAVLSYDVWQQYFDGNRQVIGQAVKLDGRAYTVIGVMPAGFRFPLGMEKAIYTPHLISQDWMHRRGNHWLRTVGLLKDGVSVQQAQADLNQVLNNISRAYPDTDGGRKASLQLLGESVVSHSKGPLWTLLAAVLAVLTIGTVNVTGLLLARGIQRRREIAMRVAIGANRSRILAQVLTEGVLLALLGAAAGVLLASVLLQLMRTFLVKALARGADVHLNWQVLLVAVGLAVVDSLAASLYPALRLSGTDPNRALKTGGNAGVERSQHRVRAAFVITQVALTMVLLVVAGLLIRVVTRYRNADLGFEPSHIAAVSINFAPPRYAGRDVIADLYQPLLERVQHIPGVRAAGYINILPIENWGSNSDIHIAGQPPNPLNQVMLAEGRIVSTGYFDVFGIPLHRGRALSPSLDRSENAASTVLVNDAFVRKFIPNGLDPLAQKMDDDPKPEKWTQIAGVVGNVRQDIYEPALPERDWLMEEIPPKERVDNLNALNLVIRFDGDVNAITPALRSALHDVDPTVPFGTVRTMLDVVSETLVFERMEGWLFGIFAGLALVLALVGLCGLVTHEVEQGTRDIGVRMALGATRGRILGTVLRRVAWMVTAGVVFGLVLTMAVRKLIGVVIYFEAQQEAGSLALLALLLVAAGLLAALLPAMRAASVEPVTALRMD